MNLFLTVSILLFSVGCQLAPTKIKQDIGGFAGDVVLIDTRNSLAYSSYHVSGSMSLNSEDFIILKNPAIQKRGLDSDLDQVVERLARRGISPLKKIVLISDKKDSDENKKWQWLLRKLDVTNIESISLDEYIEKTKPLRPRSDPDRADVWPVHDAKGILSKSDNCFMTWSESLCAN